MNFLWPVSICSDFLKLYKLLCSVNRAEKHLSAVAAWENSKKAALEAQLRKIEVLFVAQLLVDTMT